MSVYLWLAALTSVVLSAQAQHPLYIPPLVSGPAFELNVQQGVHEFIPGIETPTYGVNGPFLAPTLLVRKGDTVTLNVSNSLGTSTTMHWHGFNLPAYCDGGPHQVIRHNSTWSPRFAVLNDAATYWYHPHGEGKTELHVAKGLSGLIIVQDSAEARLTLPRTYGVDDIPVILQTKAFDEQHQIAIATEMDTMVLVNGTRTPFHNVPAQVLRFRVLNGSSMRNYLLGFSDSRMFYLIGSDDGLLARPIALSRVRVAPGERVELLVDCSPDSAKVLFLRNYGSEIPDGVHGAKNVGMGMAQIHDYESNFLNGKDFDLLQLNVREATTTAVRTIPETLVPHEVWKVSDAAHSRTLEFTPETMGMKDMVEGPFLINGKRFSMDVINEVVRIGDIEVWSLRNSTLIAHPFHIHQQYVYILERNGIPVGEAEGGKKDVVLVMPNETLRFITKFENYSDEHLPYMYHCHMLHHEDDGMMGSFLVVDSVASTVPYDQLRTYIYPNPADHTLCIDVSSLQRSEAGRLSIIDNLGTVIYSAPLEESQSRVVLDLREYRSATYTCVIRSTLGVTQRSFVVIH